MFQLPQFNLTIEIWDPPGSPLTTTATRTALAQFYVRGIGISIQPNHNALWQPPIFLRAPMGTVMNATGFVRVPGGLAPYYRIRWVEPIHLGLTNEYVQAVVEQVIF